MKLEIRSEYGNKETKRWNLSETLGVQRQELRCLRCLACWAWPLLKGTAKLDELKHVSPSYCLASSLIHDEKNLLPKTSIQAHLNH